MTLINDVTQTRRSIWNTRHWSWKLKNKIQQNDSCRFIDGGLESYLMAPYQLEMFLVTDGLDDMVIMNFEVEIIYK
jgi:hypothetical protein